MDNKFKVWVVYDRNDLDGVCSGAIAGIYLENIKEFAEVLFFGWRYGDDFPQIKEGDRMILVDLSFPVMVMEDFNKRVKNLIWIDHHKTAIENNKHLKLDGKQSTQKSACELSWEYFFPQIQIPDGIKMLGIYDTWRKSDPDWDWDSEIIPFQYGMRVYPYHPLLFPIGQLCDPKGQEFIQDTILNGENILGYLDNELSLIADRSVYTKVFEGHNAVVLNTQNHGRINFKSVTHDADLMICYSREKEDKWRISLYSDVIDVSEIAKKFKGGGHTGAAGFIVKDISTTGLTL